MKSIKIILLCCVLFITSCQKEQIQPKQEELSIDYSKPIMIQIEAVHEDGAVVKSPIFVLKY